MTSSRPASAPAEPPQEGETLFPRHASRLILEGLADTRVVLVVGARQVGKSTLASEIAADQHFAQTITLDTQPTREPALRDPAGFVAGLKHPVLIDEVQRVPDLLLEIKRDVDRNLTPGRYLLTGSANIVTLRAVKDALTGRMDIVRMWPLSQAEIRRSEGNFVDAMFAANPPFITGAPIGRNAFVNLVAAGGYPEARIRSETRRDNWFARYIDTTLDRDLRDISDARKLDEIPRMLRLLAAQAANTTSLHTIADRLNLNHDTVRNYFGLLQTLFLIHQLPAWRPGIGAREVRLPKTYFVDSGLLTHLLGANESRIADDDQITGKAFENFVVMEILKHIEWSQLRPRPYHYRNRNDEVDLLLETRSGDIIGIEIKAAGSIHDRALRPLEKLRDSLGERFKAGALLYAGENTISLGDRLWALPVSSLWA